MLREEGGPFGMGAVVELGDIIATPSPPEVEDHRFQMNKACHIEEMDDDDFLALLDEMSSPDLASAFGPALERVGDWKYATQRSCGDGSLAVIAADKRPVLAINRFDELEIRFNDVKPQTYVRVNDIRFYEEDQKTIKAAVVEDVRKRLRRGVDAYLMFGLTRAYPREDPKHHWLQLNGLCLVDRPVSDIP
jgi:hypothetical protein